MYSSFKIRKQVTRVYLSRFKAELRDLLLLYQTELYQVYKSSTLNCFLIFTEWSRVAQWTRNRLTKML